MILLIDNYDSFTYNLYQFLAEENRDVKVVRNDKITIEEIAALKPKAIVLSPGPGRPENAGICVELIKQLHKTYPILGVCLGHQAIGYAFGGSIVGAESILHGKTSLVYHNSKGIFKDIPSPLLAGRYHSLVIDKNSLPKELIIEAESDTGVIMSVRHRIYPCFGVQFHPESVLTPDGKKLLLNFINSEVRAC